MTNERRVRPRAVESQITIAHYTRKQLFWKRMKVKLIAGRQLLGARGRASGSRQDGCTANGRPGLRRPLRYTGQQPIHRATGSFLDPGRAHPDCMRGHAAGVRPPAVLRGARCSSNHFI